MATGTVYPISLDSFTDKVDDIDDILSVETNTQSSAIEALQLKVGIDNSTDVTSHEYKINNVILTDPTTTRGDILVRNASALSRLAVGAADEILTSDGLDPVWSALKQLGGALSKDFGVTYNLSLVYSSSTLSIKGSDGLALSSSNKGYVSIPSKATPGKNLWIPITTDQGFIDDTGASEIVGNTFGTTSSIIWNNMPFYIYAVLNDDEDKIAFMIARTPNRTTAPINTDIGHPTNPAADNDQSFFSFEIIDRAEYDQNPCVCIGSFRMDKSTGADYTVQTLNNQDGIGKFQEGVLFTFPKNQNGAAPNTYLLDNGETAPVFNTNIYEYSISKAGFCTIYVDIGGDGGIDGVGAVTALLALPIKCRDTSFTSIPTGYVDVYYGGATTVRGQLKCLDNTTTAQINKTPIAVVQNGDFTNGGRAIVTKASYLMTN